MRAFITREKLNKILEEHKHWIDEDCKNWKEMRADLSRADLRNADLRDIKNVPYIPMVCPEEGDFIGWKKAKITRGREVIVKLSIPSDAKRSSATTRKCRCSKAEVIAIYNLNGTEARETTCHSDYDNSFIYEVGKTVEVTDFSEDRWNECAKSIILKIMQVYRWRFIWITVTT